MLECPNCNGKNLIKTVLDRWFCLFCQTIFNDKKDIISIGEPNENNDLEKKENQD